jgi:hypothetical protein
MTDYLLCVLIALIALCLSYWMTRTNAEEEVTVPWVIATSLAAGGTVNGLLRLVVWLADLAWGAILT